MPKRDLVDIVVFMTIVVVLAFIALDTLGTQISLILTTTSGAL